MRVMHFLERVRLQDGGVVRVVLDLCAGLAEHGHDATLATFDATDVPADWLAGKPGTPRVLVLPPPVTRLRILSRDARRMLRQAIPACDAVHLHGLWETTIPQVAGIARECRVPYVLSAHGMLDEWSMSQKTAKKKLFLQLFGNTVLRNASTVHCTAQGEASQVAPWTKGAPTSVVPCMMDLTPYRVLPDRAAAKDHFKLSADLPVVAFVSRLHPKKGLEHLIEAAANLARIGKPVQLLIAGSGEPAYEAQLKDLARSSGLEHAAHFVGFVSGPRKVLAYRAADMMALPTYQENFGLVITESLACQTPVITTRAVDIAPELESSGSALIIDRPEWAPLADAIARLIDDPALRTAMGAKGREWTMDHVGPRRVVGEFESVYAAARRAV